MKRLLFQFIGQVGLIITAPKMWRWARQLKQGPIKPWDGLIQAPIPMVDAHTGYELNWGIERLPSSHLPQAPPGGLPSRNDWGTPAKSAAVVPSNGNGFGRRIGLPIVEPQPTAGPE